MKGAAGAASNCEKTICVSDLQWCRSEELKNPCYGFGVEAVNFLLLAIAINPHTQTVANEYAKILIIISVKLRIQGGEMVRNLGAFLH